MRGDKGIERREEGTKFTSTGDQMLEIVNERGGFDPLKGVGSWAAG